MISFLAIGWCLNKIKRGLIDGPFFEMTSGSSHIWWQAQELHQIQEYILGDDKHVAVGVPGESNLHKFKDRMYLVRKTPGQTLEQIDSMFADIKVMLTGAMEDLHTLD